MKEVTMLKADGFDAAILGIGSRCGKPDILIYDYNKCCDILMERDDMTREEAIEFMVRGELKERYEELQNIVKISSVNPLGARGAQNTGTL